MCKWAKLTPAAFKKALADNRMVGDGEDLWLTPINGHCYCYYRHMLDGRRGAISPGRADRVGLAEARAKASALLLPDKAGNDPKASQRRAKAERKRAKTFAEAAEALLAANRDKWRGSRTLGASHLINIRRLSK